MLMRVERFTECLACHREYLGREMQEYRGGMICNSCINIHKVRLDHETKKEKS